jgi:hypothetical protein
MSKHQHKWRTRYVTIRDVDCASGMECNCGATLHADDVEDIINSVGPTIELIERWQALITSLSEQLQK